MFRFGDPGGRIYTTVGAANANLLAWWTAIFTGGSSLTVSAGNGRTGGSSLRFSLAAFPQIQLMKTLDARATWGQAFAFRTSVLPITGSTQLCLLQDNGTLQCDLRLNSAGTLSVTRNGTVLGTSAVSLAANVYYHIEMLITISATVGTVGLWINSVNQLNLTAQNTQNTANATANQVLIGDNRNQNNGTSATWDYDDYIVYDGQAADANGFTDINSQIGDCGLLWLLPTGAGTTTGFVPNTAPNWSQVNEATPDGDTTYVLSPTVGTIDTYAMADPVGTVNSVRSVASVHYARKDDVGARGMKAELRASGGNTAHATELALGNSYLYYFSNWGRNPNNGSPTNWTIGNLTSVEAGQTVSS